MNNLEIWSRKDVHNINIIEKKKKINGPIEKPLIYLLQTKWIYGIKRTLIAMLS